VTPCSDRSKVSWTDVGVSDMSRPIYSSPADSFIDVGARGYGDMGIDPPFVNLGIIPPLSELCA